MPGLLSLASFLQPLGSSIPVTSLSTGNYSANNWTGITSPATTIFTAGDGRKYIRENPDNSGIIATGVNWRDQEVTTYIASGTIRLRSISGGGLFFSVGVAAPGVIRMGIISGGVQYNTLVEDSPSVNIPNWPTDGSHSITFGVRGFDVYLKIDGVQATNTNMITALNPTGAIAYKEYRQSAMLDGAPSVQPSNGTGARDITFTYFPITSLFSSYASNTFDPRDFGWRSISAVTGSMSAASNSLTLSAARDIRVGDQVIVEVGGESGAGARNTIGVGGVSPSLHYANTTAMNADTGKANGTLAYLDTTGIVYQSNSGVWTAYNFLPYYTSMKNPLSLVARVTAVNGSPATVLTLNTSATVATTAANVYIDVSAAMYPLMTNPAEVFQTGRSDGLDVYAGMTVSLPAGTLYNAAFSAPPGSGDRASFIIQGAGRTQTLIRSAKGTPSGFINSTFNDSATVKDLTYTGNLGANGFGYPLAANGQFSGGLACGIILWGANVSTLNIGMNDTLGGGISLSGVNPTIDGAVVNFTQVQDAYLGWQLQLANSTGGIIKNSSSTSVKLLKVFEMFACNGAEIRDVTGTNALTSTNSSTNVTFTRPQLTILANSFYDVNSGAIDEPVMSVNNSAFGSGNTITIVDPRVVQSGYIDASNNSLKAIQVLHTNITDVTITGQYPESGPHTTTAGGYFSAPNYDAGSAEFGSMAVMSDAARTIVSGIRVQGSAIGTPGHSGHWGNISLLGASSQVNNCVVDVIQPGPTQSGNQSNSGY